MKCRETQVLALEPDDAFARHVLAYKERIRQLVDEQLYLDDPPHVTLYLGVYDARTDLAGPIRALCRRLAVPTVAVRGWHVFEADQLTGNHTLVCDVTPETRSPLEQIQREAVGMAAPLRNPNATRACYDKSWHRLSEEERANVERFGFPFVGLIWHPHVTVASVRPEDWLAVWSELAGTPPDAVVRFPFLAIYGLKADQPVLIERLSLEDVG
jgi:2'-5' RNA ligase